MTEKVVTKVSFIGGRLVYPGEKVDVDAKGEVLPADSTPIGNLTVEQLRGLLAVREKTEAAPEFGDNVADATDMNTGAQPLEIASFRPGKGPNPQGLPPGTVPGPGDSFVRPASEDAPAAVEVVVGEGAEEGSVSAEPGPPIATGKTDVSMALNKGDLLKIAQDEGVTVETDDNKADIIAKIENARKG